MFLTYIWRMQQVFPTVGQFRPTILVGLLALFIFMAKPDLEASIKALRHPTFRYIMLLFGWMVLSIPTSLFQRLSFSFVFMDHVKTVLFVVLIAAGVRAIADVQRLALVQLLGGILYCTVTLIRNQGGGPRFAGVATYDANDFAQVLVCTLPVALYFIARGRNSAARLIALVAALTFAFLVVRTGSRGGFLGLAAIAAYLLFNFKAVRRPFRIVTVVAGMVAVFAFAGDEWTHQMRTILTPKQDYNWNSEAGRLKIWTRGMGFMLDRPITGVGANAFYVAEGRFSDLARQRALEGRGMKWSTAHNSFIQVGAELGLPGLWFFILMLWTAFRAAHRIGQHPAAHPDDAALGQALSASVVGFVVTGFFLSAGYHALLYGLMGLIIGFTHVARVGTVVRRPALSGQRGGYGLRPAAVRT